MLVMVMMLKYKDHVHHHYVDGDGDVDDGDDDVDDVDDVDIDDDDGGEVDVDDGEVDVDDEGALYETNSCGSCWLPSILNNICLFFLDVQHPKQYFSDHHLIVFIIIAVDITIVKTIVIIIIIIIMIDIKGRVAGQHPEGTLIGLTTLSSGHLDAMAPYLIFVLFFMTYIF